jgi:hypothetical protein
VRLLQRVGALVSDEGELLVELDPPGTPAGTFTARLELIGGTASERFYWARVAFDEADRLTADASLRVLERWRARLGKQWLAPPVAVSEVRSIRGDRRRPRSGRCRGW